MTKKIAQWLDTSFESSSSTTPEFAAFAAQYRRELKKQLAKDLELVGFNRGHFYLSGFIKNSLTGKYAYFMTDDVRFSVNGWHNQVLMRTAKHEKDYTGGRNDWASWGTMRDKALMLTL